jgi:hypothetical protein
MVQGELHAFQGDMLSCQVSSSKPVPNGALAWHLDASITARVSKFHFGTESMVPWHPYDLEVAIRPRLLGLSGEFMTPGGFSCIVDKVLIGDESCGPGA